jgi:RNA polymerase subunit RPABC4/transcription elongation factor Spt4
VKKVYEICPRCSKKQLFLTGPRSWTTTFLGRQVKTCRGCGYIEPPTKEEA